MAKDCSLCGNKTHTAFSCRKRRKPLKQSPFKSKHTNFNKVSAKKQRKHDQLKREWFAENPPDYKGGYTCYLQISQDCPKWVSKKDVTLEHVYSKAGYPELVYVTFNIKPACSLCNGIKLSNTVEKLAVIYPQLVPMINSEDWRRFVVRLSQYSERLALQVEQTK